MNADSLRVLMVLRPDASARWGGDTALALDTAGALRAEGVTVDVVETAEPTARGHDIAHVFNVGDPDVAERQIAALERSGTPIALSPVWLDLRELDGRGRCYECLLVRARNARRVAKTLQRWSAMEAEQFLGARERRALGRRLERQRALCRAARVLLPNSATEMRDCLLHLRVHDVPAVAVRIPAKLEPAAFWRPARERDGIVAVGRIETRKNQTTALFALRDLDVPVDIIGACYDPGLQRAGQRWCSRARFHGSVPRDQVLTALGKAAVHVLVSWCETAGVATMEAALAGARVVVSDRGAEAEYFGDDAEYANPADPESICAAVRRALARPARAPGDALDRRLRSWTWQQAARETLRAYRIALGEIARLDHGLANAAAG